MLEVLRRIGSIHFHYVTVLGHHREWYSALGAGIAGMLMMLFFDEQMLEKIPRSFWWSLVIVGLFFLSVSVSLRSGGVPFIYFQF